MIPDCSQKDLIESISLQKYLKKKYVHSKNNFSETLKTI